MPYTRQTNFLGGEISPYLWGRTDLPLWAAGLKTCRNFFISRQGMAVSRPGTTFVCAAKNQQNPPRLIPFIISDSESWVLEFGHQYIRFILAGSQATDGGDPIELATTYHQAELRDVRYAQVGDVLTLTHPSHPPRELKRTAGVWSLTDVDFRLLELRNVDVSNQLVATAPWRLVQESAGYLTDPSAAKLREWRYLVTAVVREAATGRTFETRGFEVDSLVLPYAANAVGAMPADRKLSLAPAHPIRLLRISGAGTTYGSAYHVLRYVIFRGRGGLFGFVGTTTTTDFVDVGEEPDFRIQPPRGKEPFTYLQTLPPFSTVRNDFPAAVGYFEERRVFGGLRYRPGFVLFSASGNYYDFDDESLLPNATQALTYELASRRRERIRDVIGLRRLLIFTSSSVWSMAGSGGEPLSPETLPLVQVEDEVGSAGPSPLIVDGMALYVRAKGRGVRAIVADDTGGFSPRDASSHSEHLFIGEPFGGQLLFGETVTNTGTRNIVDWAYQEDPWGIVWAVREDGVLLTMTPLRESGAFAWARHDTGAPIPTGGQANPAFKSVCVVPEGTEDGVYVVVQRAGSGLPNSGRCFIEKLNSRSVTHSRHDYSSVDSGRRYYGVVTDTLAGWLPHLRGMQVYAIGQGFAPIGPLTVEEDGTVRLGVEPPANAPGPILGGPRLDMYVGLPFTCDLELLDVISTGTRAQQKTTVKVGFEVDNATGLMVGQDFNHLTEWRQRRVADSYGAVGAATELVVVPVLGTYDKAARAVLRQSQPLPVTVTGILREVDVGG